MESVLQESMSKEPKISPENMPVNSKKKKKGFLHEVKQNYVLFLMLLLPLIYIVVQFYLPMIGLVVAFKNYNYVDGIFNSPWDGFDNFKFLFHSDQAWIITRNTILYNFAFIILGLVFAVTAALVLNELKNKYAAKFYQSVMFLPYFLSWVVVAYIVLALLEAKRGMINRSFFQALGMTAPSWYQEPKYWPFILTFTNIWKTIGYSMVIYLAAITGIDGVYYEAAVLDGCSKIKQAWYITIPFLKPMMIILTIMALGNIFRSDFGLFYQVPMNQGMIFSTTNTIDTYVYRGMMGSGGTMSMSSAAGFYQSCVGFVVVLFANWVISKISSENRVF